MIALYVSKDSSLYEMSTECIRCCTIETTNKFSTTCPHYHCHQLPFNGQDYILSRDCILHRYRCNTSKQHRYRCNTSKRHRYHCNTSKQHRYRWFLFASSFAHADHFSGSEMCTFHSEYFNPKTCC